MYMIFYWFWMWTKLQRLAKLCLDWESSWILVSARPQGAEAQFASELAEMGPEGKWILGQEAWLSPCKSTHARILDPLKSSWTNGSQVTCSVFSLPGYDDSYSRTVCEKYLKNASWYTCLKIWHFSHIVPFSAKHFVSSCQLWWKVSFWKTSQNDLCKVCWKYWRSQVHFLCSSGCPPFCF